MSPSFVIAALFLLVIGMSLYGFGFASYRLFTEWRDASPCVRMQTRDNLVGYLALNGLLVALGVLVTNEAVLGFRSNWSAQAINTMTGIFFFASTAYVCFRKKRTPALVASAT